MSLVKGTEILYIAISKTHPVEEGESTYDIIRVTEYVKLEVIEPGIVMIVGKGITFYPWHRILEVYSREV